MNRTPSHSRGGFTLLEMLIVGMLGVLVVTFTANATRWYSRSIKNMHVTSQLDRELKLAAEAISQDFGASLAARTTDGTDLQLNVDDGDAVAQWAAPDTVVQYTLSGGVLRRSDLAAGTDVPMARNIAAFDAAAAGLNLNVHVVAEYRDLQQDLTVQLQNP